MILGVLAPNFLKFWQMVPLYRELRDGMEEKNVTRLISESVGQILGVFPKLPTLFV